MIHERHKQSLPRWWNIWGLKGGPGAGLALSTCPVNRLTTFTSQVVFHVILLRRLHLPLPVTLRNCLCGLLYLTLVAITVQVVPGFWDGEVGPLRTLQQGWYHGGQNDYQNNSKIILICNRTNKKLPGKLKCFQGW